MDVDPRLRELLQREADRAVLPDRLHRDVLRRAGIRRRITAVIAAGGLVVVAFGGVAAIQGLRSLVGPGPVSPGSRTPGAPEERDAAVAEPTPTGPRIVVAEGTVAGRKWALVAYNSNVGICQDLELGTGGSKACGWEVPEVNDLGLSAGSQTGVPGSIVHGVLSKRVESLEARLKGGPAPAEDVVPIEIIEGSPEFNVDFFAAFLPAKAWDVIAKGIDGVTLQSVPLKHEPVRHQEPFTEVVLDQHKITVYYPEGWHRAPTQLAPAADEIFALGTYPLRPGAGECPEIPEAALEDLQPGDAFVSLQESTSGNGFRPRPTSFSFVPGDEPEWMGCLENRAHLFVRVFRFSHQGRFFNAIVAWETSASKETMAETWGILDNLLLCDLYSRPGDCL